MLTTIRKQSPAGDAVQELGTITAVADCEWTVQTRSGAHRARRAVSCVVTPVLDDEVMLAVGEDGRTWILAILERRRSGPLQLDAPGDLTLRVPNGRIALAARDGLDLSTAGATSIDSGELQITASEATIQVEGLSYLGRWVHSEVERVKLFATSMDTVVERFWQKVKRSFRFVEEVDQVRAGEIEYSARTNAHIHAENTLLTAEQLVKVDAGQIHLG